jgi:hypothetical protein
MCVWKIFGLDDGWGHRLFLAGEFWNKTLKLAATATRGPFQLPIHNHLLLQYL